MKSSAAAIIETPPPPQAPPPAPPASPPVLSGTRLMQPGQFWAEWQVSLPPDQTLDDARRPGFWRAHMGRLNLGDVVTIRTHDLKTFASLVVVEFSRARQTIRLAELTRHTTDGATFTALSTDAYEIAHSGDVQTGYRVTRNDGRIVRDGFSSVEEARRFINSDLAPRIIGRDA